MNNIINAISNSLYDCFGDDYTITSDTVVLQDMSTPCFFITSVYTDKIPLLGCRYYMSCVFDILYFPKNKIETTELHDTGALLFKALEVIELENGEKLRGVKPSTEIVDNVLHFKITYNQFFYDYVESEKMENCEVSI